MKGEKSYIVIYSFMVDDLKLNPSELIVFAYIYGFCLKYGVCDSSLAFISKKTGISKRNVIYILERLVSKGYLIKAERETLKGNIANTYDIDKSIDKLSMHKNQGSKETLPDGSENLALPSSEKNALPNDKVVQKMSKGSENLALLGSENLAPQENNIENSKNRKEIEIKNKDKEIVDDDPNEPSWNELIAELRV